MIAIFWCVTELIHLWRKYQAELCRLLASPTNQPHFWQEKGKKTFILKKTNNKSIPVFFPKGREFWALEPSSKTALSQKMASTKREHGGSSDGLRPAGWPRDDQFLGGWERCGWVQNRAKQLFGEPSTRAWVDCDKTGSLAGVVVKNTAKYPTEVHLGRMFGRRRSLWSRSLCQRARVESIHWRPVDSWVRLVKEDIQCDSPKTSRAFLQLGSQQNNFKAFWDLVCFSRETNHQKKVSSVTYWGTRFVTYDRSVRVWRQPIAIASSWLGDSCGTCHGWSKSGCLRRWGRPKRGGGVVERSPGWFMQIWWL